MGYCHFIKVLRIYLRKLQQYLVSYGFEVLLSLAKPNLIKLKNHLQNNDFFINNVERKRIIYEKSNNAV